jgi:hypothetical protein
MIRNDCITLKEMKLMIKKIVLTLTVLSAFFNIASAYSAEVDVSESSRCNRYFSLYERKNHMPSNMLRAIAITESGRYSKEAGRPLAWPWTINVHGKGYQYNSKDEVIAAVKQFQAAGKTSIDVGCMQINLKYHPDAFTNLEQAFEPRYNIAYAAKFLTDKYKTEGSWEAAISNYHNADDSIGGKYVSLVNKAWRAEDKSVSVAWLDRHSSWDVSVRSGRAAPKPESGDVSDITKSVLQHFVR